MSEQDPPTTPDPDDVAHVPDVEVSRYGPPPSQPNRPTWGAAPAWSVHPAPPPPPRERRGLGALSVVTIALVTAIVSGSLSAAAVANLLRTPTGSSPNGPTGTSVSQVHLDESSAVITAVARVMPAVVTITARSDGGVVGGANGIGSGFIFDADGWILTNKHVVDGATEISVQLTDSRVFVGRVYGIDTLTDLAIVKIEETASLAMVPSSVDVVAGQKVCFEVTNTAGFAHNFYVGPTSDIEARNKTDAVAGTPDFTSGAQTVEFTPTGSGPFEYACWIAGHLEAGMKGSINLTP